MRILFCLLTVFFIACSSKLDVPSGILPFEKMQSVIWDMLRADALVSNQAIKDTSLNKVTASTNMYQQVFKIHNITKEEFKRSLKYYQSRPDLLQPMFDTLYNKASVPVEVHTKPTPQ